MQFRDGCAPLEAIHRPKTSLDDLVSAGEDRLRHREAERLGRVEVGPEAESRRFLVRQVCGSRPFENGVNQACQAVEDFAIVEPCDIKPPSRTNDSTS
jgi:hypothetical protein